MDGISDRDGGTSAHTLVFDTADAPRRARRSSPVPSADRVGPDTALALALLREIAAGAYLMDPDGRVTQVNPAGLEQLGVDHLGDAHGRYLWDLWPDAVKASLIDALDDASQGEATVLDVRCPAQGGGQADCRVRMLPIEDGEGSVNKILAIARPV